ncbi:hypothetical protein BLA18110_02089 [Burkholderia lata]|uniref:hypothetical protein n=1 Tax=Burkholderia cepacia complex TaxID=87882 RepID=UPI0014547B8C|nr:MULTISPECIES: hypothetical protein [Burkholderia cepacia complex]MCA8048056.1 hypothetical protein [Burkholderia arboris]VWC72323.1 hypothetical protein BLA18110_02089 [Burkholderia lata]
MTTIDITSLTKVERSIILYAESCSVEYGGLLEGMRMNDADLVSLGRFEDAGILSFGRVPAALLEPLSHYGRKPTHWVTFTDEAWQLAHLLRRERAARGSASRKQVNELLAENLSRGKA